MNRKKYTSALVNADKSSKFWRMAVVLMMLSNLGLVAVVAKIDTAEKTIVVPAAVSEGFTIEGGEASDSYLEMMARFFSQQLLSYHKLNAKAQFDVVLKYADPEIYSALTARFDLENQRIVRNNLSSIFYPMEMHIKRPYVYLTGELVGMVGTRIVSRKEKIFAFEFGMNSTGIKLLGFNEVTRNQIGEYEIIPEKDDVMVEPTTQDEAPS